MASTGLQRYGFDYISSSEVILTPTIDLTSKRPQRLSTPRIGSIFQVTKEVSNLRRKLSFLLRINLNSVKRLLCIGLLTSLTGGIIFVRNCLTQDFSSGRKGLGFQMEENVLDYTNMFICAVRGSLD